MSLDDAATAYDLFTGRFSGALARRFIDLVDASPGQRLLDVGCGPGALTRLLVDRAGASGVAAVDPSEAFVEAARARLPGVHVRRSAAEELPYADRTFDATLAQLVVHFMANPVVPFQTFQEWWEPFTLGVGSGGAYVKGLDEQHREALRTRLEDVLGPGPFSASASAWSICATAATDT